MKKHITQRKNIFIVTVLLLIGTIALGSVALRNYSSMTYVRQTIAYHKYKRLIQDDLATLPISTATAGGVPVLVYHGITDTSERFAITQAQFADQMMTLRRAGYTTVRMSELEQFLKGERTLPDKSFLLTFDDARRDSFVGADPVLHALGYTAVMYVPTEDFIKAGIGGGYYLSERELKSMIKSGRWELGSHAVQQFGDTVPIDAEGKRANLLSNKMWLADLGRLESDEEYDARIGKELTQSKQDLEKYFGISITSFAYPSSDYGQQSTNNKEHAQEVIGKYIAQQYNLAFQQVSETDNQFTLSSPGDDMLHLHRIEPGNDWDGARLLATLTATRAQPFPLDLNNAVWKRIWGSFTPSDRGVTLTTTTEKAGSSVFVDGTKGWRTYRFQTTVPKHAVEAVTLYVRFQDDTNTLACTFTDGYTRITQKYNGITKVLAETRYRGTGTSVVSASVTDRRIACGRDGAVAAETNNPNVLRTGGIGVGVWSSVLANRSIVFSNMRAEEIR